MPQFSVGFQFTLTNGTVCNITERISQGGFAETWKIVLQPPKAYLPLTYVLKVPLAEHRQDKDLMARFDREAAILGNIKHPNVAASIALWPFHDGDKALVQELVEGAQPLDDYILANPGREASLLIQALYALRAISMQCNPPIVHRDISPSNLLVNAAGQLKVIDFGLAKEDPRKHDKLTRTGQYAGTPGYMAPEVISDWANVDHRADQFSVGIAFAAAMQVRPPQAARPHELDEPFRTILERMTKGLAGQRYPNAEIALAEAFGAIVAHPIQLTDLELHIDEMGRVTVPGWPALASMQLAGLGDWQQSDIRMSAKIDDSVFTSPDFNARAVFTGLQASTAVKELANGGAQWSDADPFGDLYLKLFRALDAGGRLACFKQLVEVALAQQQYSVMYRIRDAYELEKDPTARGVYGLYLDHRDPGKTIHGHRSIPGR